MTTQCASTPCTRSSQSVAKRFILLQARLPFSDRNRYFARKELGREPTNDDLVMYFYHHAHDKLNAWFDVLTHEERWLLLSVGPEEDPEATLLQYVRQGDLRDPYGWFADVA